MGRHFVFKMFLTVQHIQRKVHHDKDMVFNATFNNISVISWWSVLLVEQTVVPEENH
jgi:hypothetical protein